MQTKTKPCSTLSLLAAAVLATFSAQPTTGFAQTATVITNVLLPGYAGNVAVNPSLNKIYCSGGASGAQPIVIIDGNAFTSTTAGSGMGVDVDVTNNNYWSGGVYSDNVTAWSSSNVALASPGTGSGCTFETSVDAPHRRVWAGAQCGDSIWVFNADTYATIAGPISPGSVMGGLLVNPATDRAYFSSGGSKRVNPSTFAVTANAFGYVLGANASANLLYAVNNNTNLQIINGAPDPEVIITNVNLPFQFGYYIGVNAALNRIYVGSSASNVVMVLNATNGSLIQTISLGSGVAGVFNIAVDAGRNRVYADASASGSTYLYVIQDNAPVFRGAACFGIANADVTGTGIKYASGSIYACANNSASSGLIASYATPVTPSASPVWNATWPDSNPSDQFFGISSTTNGLYLAGPDYTRTTDTVGGKEGKGLTLKFPFTGATGGGYAGDIWDQQTPAAPGAFTYGGSEGLGAVTVASENSTNFIYVIGTGQHDGGNGGRLFVSKLTEGSTVLWTQNDGAEMVGEAYSTGRAVTYADNNLYAAGLNCDSNSFGQPYLRKYSPTGSFVWRRNDSFVGCYNGITSLGSYLYAVGYSGTNSSPTATLDFLVEKWDENGNQIWSRTYDRNLAQSSLTGVINVNGRLFASGYTRGQTAGGADAVLVEIDPNTGNLLSTTLYGGTLDDMANGLDSDGANLYVVGQTRSFGNGSNQLMVLEYSLAAPMLTNLVVVPSSAIIAAGSNQLFTATGYYSDMSSKLLYSTNGLVWNSSNPAVATINTNGQATGLSLGSTMISATSGSISNSASLTVVVPPTISTNPVNTTASSGGAVSLNVVANGGALSYQWMLNGTNIIGATNATLAIGNFSAANVGSYTVKITNVAGTVASVAVSLATADIKMFAGVVVDGPLGSNYLIQAASNLSSNWTTLTNLALPSQPYIYIDYNSPTNVQQFYRVVPE